MRIFVYKFLLIIFGIFLLYQFTVGYTISKIESKIYSTDVKQYSVYIQDKIRKEIENLVKKDKIFEDKDLMLIKKFINKLSNELNIKN